ncbi:MAG TPA: FixH family protein [Lamprocystis sp. (in: g-proteobacteria)]|nr:FixH family protein [Lamprocystis sp. (in: g-proteobacteria)]
MLPSAQRLNSSTSPWRNPWVLGWLGLILVVLAVNVTFIYLAVSTSPGLVSEDFYDRGQEYERTLVSRLAKDPGWTMRLDFPDDLRPGVPATVRVVLVDKAGQPVTPDQVTFFAYRPSDKTRDFSAPMVAEGPGRYAASVSFPLFGAWDGLIAVGQGEEEVTNGERIIVTRP